MESDSEIQMSELKQPQRRESISGWIEKQKQSRRVKYPTRKEGLMNALSILKLIIFSSFSTVDVATDLWVGLDLMLDFQDKRSVALKAEAKEYGKVVLAVVWLPGIVAVTHLVAHHRHEFLQRKLEFLAKSILLMVFYPIVAPLSLVIKFFYETNKGSLQKNKLRI